MVAIGPALVRYVPLNGLRIAVGGLLLVFGLQWLRKAVLRAVGLKAKHDEDTIFAEHVSELSAGPSAREGARLPPPLPFRSRGSSWRASKWWSSC